MGRDLLKGVSNKKLVVVDASAGIEMMAERSMMKMPNTMRGASQ
jgi:CO dehydrogenase nickel-insertion accessory protein CooC1